MKTNQKEFKDGLGHEFSEGSHAFGCLVVGILLMVFLWVLITNLIRMIR